MTPPKKSRDTLVYRLSQVLQKLNQGESLDPQALADELGVNLRTIQRDLNVRFATLPLVKSAGRYRLEDAHLGLADRWPCVVPGKKWLARNSQRFLLLS